VFGLRDRDVSSIFFIGIESEGQTRIEKEIDIKNDETSILAE